MNPQDSPPPLNGSPWGYRTVDGGGAGGASPGSVTAASKSPRSGSSMVEVTDASAVFVMMKADEKLKNIKVDVNCEAYGE